MSDQQPDTIRVKFVAEPRTIAGTPLHPIVTEDDIPVTEDGRVRADYTVTIANKQVTIPVDIEATDEMRVPGAVTTVSQFVDVTGPVSAEQEVVRGATGDIERTVSRRYPTSLFAVNASKNQSDDEPEPEPDDEDTEDPDPGQNAA